MIKVLWITTTPRKKIREILNLPQTSESSGTWIDSAYDQLKNDSSFHIDFASGDKKIRPGKIITGQKNGIKAFVVNLPKISFGKSGGKRNVLAWKKIFDEEQPDIIQLWGCESSVAYDVSIANSKHIPCLIYIQGVIGIHSLYQSGRIEDELIKPHNFWWIFRLFIAKEKQKYYQRQAQLEKSIIEKADFLITDNQFTKDYYRNINKNIKFEAIPLPINQVFFNSKWDYSRCRQRTIFTIFGADPNKGLHQLLKALVIVRRFFPDVKAFFPGHYSSKTNQKRKSNFSLFELWAEKFIRKENLAKNIEFVGRLSPQEMADQISNANLFVSPSCMEVQPTSVREAMIVGCPVISSICGSVLEMISPGKNGLVYRYEEYQILAAQIIRLFENPEYAKTIAINGRNSMRLFVEQQTKKSSFPELYTKCVQEKEKLY